MSCLQFRIRRSLTERLPTQGLLTINVHQTRAPIRPTCITSSSSSVNVSRSQSCPTVTLSLQLTSPLTHLISRYNPTVLKQQLPILTSINIFTNTKKISTDHTSINISWNLQNIYKNVAAGEKQMLIQIHSISGQPSTDVLD